MDPAHQSALKFWVGQSVSLVGSEVSQLAMPLLAVLSLGASPGEMGVLRAVNLAPYLLSLPIGVLVDRTRRRPLLIGVNLLRALLMGSIPLATVLSQADRATSKSPIKPASAPGSGTTTPKPKPPTALATG